MEGSRELAQVETAKGYQVGNYLLLQIAGEKPTPCHVVDIVQSPTDIFPPQFSATLTTDPAVICAQVITPYEKVEAFEVSGLGGQSVQLETGGGTIDVAVQEVEFDSEVAQPGGSVSVLDIIGPPSEAVGYSDSWDLAEAMRDAISKLPRRGERIADMLRQYEVLEVGAEIGGIAGFNHLKVRVRG
jgi:hypothetical protein